MALISETKQADLNDTESSDLPAYFSMANALEGDYARLCMRLRSNAKLRRDERDFLADFLDGIIKRPSHRPKKQRAGVRQKLEIGQFIVICERVREWKLEAVVQQAMTLYRVSRRYAFLSLQELKSDPLRFAAAKACGD